MASLSRLARARSMAGSRRQHIGIGGEFRLVVAQHLDERPHRLLRRQHAVGGSVERFDHRSQARHRGQGEPPFACHAVIQHRLVESVHAKHPFDWLPLAAKPEGAAFVESYRNDLKIKLRRRARIDAELVQACRVPPRQRRKVEKGVLDRPFHLVGEGARPGKRPKRGSRCALRLPAASGYASGIPRNSSTLA